MKKLLTGNESIARGAYEAGVHFAAAYPGTPSTEIMENIAQYEAITSEWAPNEKVALEAVIGASIAGARSMASMKHVGVNVAADPLMTFAYTGVNGGMVLITADEPGMHSSQNEQDNRNYAKFAKIPLLEPASSQECKDMLIEAFEISETFDAPVMIRMTTRVCHSKGLVECYDRNEKAIKPYTKHMSKYHPIPKHARGMRVRAEERLEKLRVFSETTPLNQMILNNSEIGVITSGVSYQYAREVFGDTASYLKLGFTNPMPAAKIAAFAKEVKTIYIIEENDPIIEEFVERLGIACKGKEVFPKMGEMTPDVIRKSLGQPSFDTIDFEDLTVPRPPAFCAGCPHRGFFYELGKLKNVVISGDIGCYALGFDEPYNATDFSICMGASISMGHGAQTIFNKLGAEAPRVISVLGDSTFFHTGINSVIEVLYNKGNSINVILDNRVTAMTGHQENPGSGYTIQGEHIGEMAIEPILKTLGAKRVRQIDPNNLKEVKETLNWALESDEASFIITRWPCALKRFTEADREEFKDAFTAHCTVKTEKCIGCKKCLGVGCPAISFNQETKKTTIDPNVCVGCEVCLQVCPVKAIEKEAAQ
ncbi:indolepyruvate ferredoxin oxidoreductase subunit alpha [Fusibacter paucivorans]|uniref:Indolepyruvate oxidoreductase subunit IorA n=1 Tax=Fusibacter paucivorans TaxID=76009 RepID=A0ABS5PLB7_9FIRM|nr:indolepyruvate ferredoxin oxidoreductase subunit alpha [Fusibacter paucivorans]MBS7525955.1 indolepyruvate ferredoxin oxidoreductase subunit alpha [Fusibacter paucivorans]